MRGVFSEDAAGIARFGHGPGLFPLLLIFVPTVSELVIEGHGVSANGID